MAEGDALLDAGKPEQALARFDEVACQRAGNAQVQQRRGLALLALGHSDAAATAFSAALAINPKLASAHYNLGHTALHLAQPEQARACYERAIALEPDFVDAHLALGYALDELDRPDAAAKSYQRVLALDPVYAEAWSNLAQALTALMRFDEAIACRREVLALRPGSADALGALAGALADAGASDEAIALYRRALESDPLRVHARFGLLCATLRNGYDDVAQQESARAAFDEALTELDAWFTPERVPLGAAAVGSAQPFHLAYQARDNRPLLERYGRICARLMAPEGLVAVSAPMAPRNGRPRIGFVSAHVRDHSVWHALLKGWVRHLDPLRFESVIFSLGREHDAETALARRLATHFVDAPRTLPDWMAAITAHTPDVLVYPEIGMHGMTLQLAAQRLAPVQVASWGHPQTSGLPTLDLFLSAEMLEPAGADAHYSEQLVRLPRLGVCIEPLVPDSAPLDLDALGLPADEPLLLCPGAPFKYAPEYDPIWVSLAQRLQQRGSGRLVFFAHIRNGLAQQLERRLRSACALAGVDYSRVVCTLDFLPRAQFFALLRRATLMLDTPGFSGFNTALQAIECALPLVAYEGDYLRGRLASGPLAAVGLSEWTASCGDEFVANAVRLMNDSAAHCAVRETMLNIGPQLFNDVSPVRALEEVLMQAVQQARS